MTQEQARQEAEKRVDEYLDIENKYKELTDYTQAKQCALISINREIELLEELFMSISSEQFNFEDVIKSKLQDLNQIKDELLKM
jgi:hypothetical protein